MGLGHRQQAYSCHHGPIHDGAGTRRTAAAGRSRARRPRIGALLGLAAAVVALAAAGVVGCGGDDGAQARTIAPRVDRFDAGRAWAWLRRQVAIGPRPAASPALRALAGRLERALPAGRIEPVPGHPGLQNVVGQLPGRRPAVLLAAHYDTKDLPGFVGANDAAGGTAMLLEVARALRHMRRPPGAPELRFALFDGEEATDDADFYGTGVRGAKAYARRYGGLLKAMVLLDFVANPDIRIPRDESSDPALWGRLRAAARRVGSGAAFPDETQGEILDDHTPFLRAGVPAIDLIDFDFNCWHKTCDDVTAVSRHSLDVVGEAVVELMRTLR